MAFIHHEKAFDSVPTAAVIEAVHDRGRAAHTGVPRHVYDGCTGTTLLHRKTKKFPIRNVVRQGATVSPKLFAAYLQGVFKKLNREKSGLRKKWEILEPLEMCGWHRLVQPDRSEVTEHDSAIVLGKFGCRVTNKDQEIKSNVKKNMRRNTYSR